MHGGILWLDRPISIEIELIVWISRLPSKFEDPLLLFTDKTKDKALEERMKEKYDTFIGAHSLDVASINGDTIWFMT